MVVLDPYGMTFDAVGVFGLAPHLLFRSWSTYCDVLNPECKSRETSRQALLYLFCAQVHLASFNTSKSNKNIVGLSALFIFGVIIYVGLGLNIMTRFGWIQGGFQLKFVSISHVVNHMTCYNLGALIGWNYSIQTREQILLILFFLNISTNESTWIYNR